MEGHEHRPISRRKVLQLGAIAVPSAILAACVEPLPSPSLLTSASASPTAALTPPITPVPSAARTGRFLFREAALADGR